jgi:hypothetical protein
MLRHLLTTTNGDIISFGEGRFDEWCIYVQRKESKPGEYLFPLDSWYFAELARIDEQEPGVYEDFIKFYNLTDKDESKLVIKLIPMLAKKYTETHLVELLYSIIYAGMIAEENKEGTKLGKRIKRLGMYQTLVEKIDPLVAANFSRNMKWQEIDEHCRQRGF